MSGQSLTLFVLSPNPIREIAVVNQTIHTMKQPELGKRISEMRKAKGLTQEELVELCNLNVRTIQRIEAGEVTPRSYTIKALFEALGAEWNDSVKPQVVSTLSSKNQLFLYVSIAAGILYFITSYFEIIMEIDMVEGNANKKPVVYAIFKLAVLNFYTLFLLGFTEILKRFPNQFLKVAVWLMLGGNAIWAFIDIIGIYSPSFSLEDYYYVKVSSFGLFYGLMGAGFLAYKNLWSNIPQIIGGLGVVTGILMFSVIGAGVGLIPMSMFEIGQIVFLIWGINKIGRTSSPDSTFTAELQN